MAERMAHAACRNTNEQKFRRYISKHGENNQMIGLCCEDCLSEWVLPEFLSNDNDANETITAAGQEFRLMKKRMLAKSQFRIQKHHAPFPDHEAAEQCLKVGDHICYETCQGLIIHHAIVTALKKDENDTRITLIHWEKNEVLKNYEVVEDKNVNLRDKAKRIFRCDYPEDYVRADSTELTIARATAWKGETNYNVFSNNCEHFAIFCKVGCPQSFQQNLVITKTLHILYEICGFGVRFATGEAKKAAGAAVGVFGEPIEYGTEGAMHFLSVSTQSIGIGVAVAINGTIFCYNLGKAYKEHKKGDLDESEFKNRIWQKFITCLERIFYTGLFPAACAVGLGLVVPNPTVALAVSVLVVGAIIGGVLATAAEGFGRTKVGCALSFMLRPILDHPDKLVESVEELHIGDHAVISRWCLHPRCHILIKSINKEEQTMTVLRFKYEKGVVEELLPFKKPVYKVIYEENECFPPNEVIERATKKKEEKTLEYGIFSNNCKSFARWCKTGRLPSGIAVKGYDHVAYQPHFWQDCLPDWGKWPSPDLVNYMCYGSI